MNNEDNAITKSVETEPESKSYFLAPVVTVQAALAAYQAKKELIEGILREGVDYGTIPGSTKPALLKAGAEKVNSFFGICPSFRDSKTIEDWTGEDHGEPFLYYRQTCDLYRGNRLVASADGSCNSWEKKYHYRWVGESEFPSGTDKTKLKTMDGKISEFAFAVEQGVTTGQYGKPPEYWQKFRDAITAGTASPIKRMTKAKKELDAWEIGSILYRVVNDEIADIANTILKMAQKRALVAATLMATGLSDYFTQDIEDYVVPGTIVEGIARDISGGGETDEPVDAKARAEWAKLCKRAVDVSIPIPEVDLDQMSKAELRVVYAELLGFVKDAEAQAASGDTVIEKEG